MTNYGRFLGRLFRFSMLVLSCAVLSVACSNDSGDDSDSGLIGNTYKATYYTASDGSKVYFSDLTDTSGNPVVMDFYIQILSSDTLRMYGTMGSESDDLKGRYTQDSSQRKIMVDGKDDESHTLYYTSDYAELQGKDRNPKNASEWVVYHFVRQ